MKQRYLYTAGLCLALCFPACQDDLGTTYNEMEAPLQLFATAPQDFIVSRAINDPVFPAETAYHLFGTKVVDNKDTWTTNYLLASYSEGKKDMAVASGMYNYDTENNQQLTGMATRFNTDPMGFYGVTIASDTSDVSANNTKLEGYLVEKNSWADGVPQYTLTYGDTPVPFPDLMYSDSLTAKKGGSLNILDHSGKIVMPYKHALSRLNFYAAKSDQESDTGIKDAKITIDSIMVRDYASGTMSMATGLFTHDGNRGENNGIAMKPTVNKGTWKPTADGAEVPINEAQKEVVLNKTPFFATALIFPTTSADYNGNYQNADGSAKTVENTDAVRVTLYYTYDADGDTGTGAAVEKEATIRLNDNGDNMAFCPHHKYNVTFTFTTTSVVVAIVPSYYEYVEEPIDLGLTQVGEPVDFGGFMWAASNLGATSANPLASPEDWEKSRGFYYQFGRSIPYYVRGSVLDPYPEVANYGSTYNAPTKGSLSDAAYKDTLNAYNWDYEVPRKLYGNSGVSIPYFHYNNRVFGLANNNNFHGARAYPYIPSLWEKLIREKGVDAGYKEFLALCRGYNHDVTNKWQTNQHNGEQVVFQYDPNEADSVERWGYNAFAFAVHVQGSFFRNARYWEKDKDATVTWDGYSMPDKSKYETSISDSYWSNPENDPCPQGWRLPTREEYFSIFPSYAKYGDISFAGYGTAGSFSNNDENDGHWGDDSYIHRVDRDFEDDPAVYVGIYQDGGGNNDLTTGVFGKSGPYKEGWGSVYGIKRRGTPDAYAIRWQILVSDADQVGGKSGLVAAGDEISTDINQDIGRGVLVISKYNLGGNPQLVNLVLNEITPKPQKAERDKATHECVIFEDKDKDNIFDADEKLVNGVDWDKPSGVLYLPITGYVISGNGLQALCYPGQEVLYWTSSTRSGYTSPDEKGQYMGEFGVSARIKYAGDYETRYIFMYDEECRTSGAHVRCIRDTRNQ